MLMEDLRENIGALCEVRNLKNDLLFVGRLEDVDGEGLVVGETDTGTIPPAIFNMEVKLNLRSNRLGLVVLAGRVGKSGESFWTVSGLRHVKSMEDRNFFRQRVSASAEVIRVRLHDVPDAEAARLDEDSEEPEEEKVPAHLVDISLGGIQFSTRVRFAVGEIVQLTNVQLVKDEVPFTFNCKILRVNTIHFPDFYCGCAFYEMPAKEQDRLCKAIFALQRNELRKRRQL